MDPNIIENPDKIGVGTWQVSGQGAMFADLDLLNANWFYTWEPSLLDAWFDDWASGGAVSVGGLEGDWELVLGSGSDAVMFGRFRLGLSSNSIKRSTPTGRIAGSELFIHGVTGRLMPDLG